MISRDVYVTIHGDVIGSQILTAERQVIVGRTALAALASPKAAQTLRVLVLIAAPVTGRRITDPAPPPLDVRGEWARLAHAVRSSGAPIALVRLMPPTLDALRYANRLKRCSPSSQARGAARDCWSDCGGWWEGGEALTLPLAPPSPALTRRRGRGEELPLSRRRRERGLGGEGQKGATNASTSFLAR